MKKSREKGRADEEVDKVVMDAPGGDRRAFQIFVKVDGITTVLMDVSQKDKVHDVVKKIVRTASESDQGVYVTSEAKVLKGN